MLPRAFSIGIITLGLLSSALETRATLAQPAPVPTGQKVITTAPAAPAKAAAASSAAAAAQAPTATTAPATPPSSVERARQGVVVIERQGKPLALGAVLDGDGRILTALSPLSQGNFLSARYKDGAVAPLKLVMSDRGWDLALLAPPSTAAQPLRKAGLRAARTPSFVGLQSFNLSGQNNVTAAPATLRLSAGMLGGDGATLAGAYELGSKPNLVGAPIVNAEGEVVALVARACPAGGGANCTPAPYATPVSELKEFLQRVPGEAAWLGVEVASDELRGVRGLRVVAVVPSGPAAVAGIRPGQDAAQADLVVAVDGTPVSTSAELNEAVRARTNGDSIEVLLFGLGRYRHVLVKPRPAPELTAPPYAVPRPVGPRTPNPYR